MRNPRLFRWKELKKTRGLLFFAQRVEETLFDYTFDSYKVPALNTHTRAIELSRGITDVVEDRQHLGALESVIDELAWSIKHDIAASALLGALHPQFSDPSWWAKKDHNQTRTQVDTLLSALASNRYEHQLIAEIKSRIDEAKKKDDLYALTTNLVGEWLRRKFSKEYIYWETRRFFFSPSSSDIDSNEKFSEFLRLFSQKKKAYSVILRGSNAILALKGVLPPELAKIDTESPPKRTDRPKEKDFLEASHEGVFVTFPSIEAVDVSAARDSAVALLGRIAEIVTCHVHRDPMTVHGEALVYDDAVPVRLREAALPLHKHHECVADDLPQAFSRTMMGSSWRLQDKESMTRFTAAIGLHASAVRSRDTAVQLTALWSALEAVLPIPVEQGKIGSVSETLVPLLCRHYPLRLITELERSLRSCAADGLIKALEMVPAEVDSNLKFAAVIAIPTLEPARDIIYGVLEKNPLLRYRVSTLKRLTDSPKHILDSLVAHRQRVEWQVRRIYRARNLIVHAGRGAPYLPTVVENLHSYLHAVFDGIEERLAFDRPRTINAAFLSLRMETEAHIAFLKATKEAATNVENLQALMVGPMLAMERQRDPNSPRLPSMIAHWQRRNASSRA